MDMISKAQAKKLATAYGAFRARDLSDHLDTSVWGKMLRDAQRETGIEMYDTDWLQKVIDRADSFLDAKAA